MACYVIIGAENEVNAELEQLLDYHCISFARYPGTRAMDSLYRDCRGVFVTAGPAGDSIGVVASVAAAYPELTVICVGARWSPDEQITALTSGARGYLSYPIVPDCLRDQLSHFKCSPAVAS